MALKKFKKIFIVTLGFASLLYGIEETRDANVNMEFTSQKNIEPIKEKKGDDINKLEEKDNISEDKQEENIKLESEILATLSIPKIKLEKNLYDIESSDNDVNKNVKILKESKMPDESNSNFILASHAGSSKVAYFNNLKKLDIGDSIFITYKDVKYQYDVYRKFEVDKDGQIVMNLNNKNNYVTLITCIIGTKKQLLVVGKLSKKGNIYGK